MPLPEQRMSKIFMVLMHIIYNDLLQKLTFQMPIEIFMLPIKKIKIKIIKMIYDIFLLFGRSEGIKG